MNNEEIHKEIKRLFEDKKELHTKLKNKIDEVIKKVEEEMSEDFDMNNALIHNVQRKCTHEYISAGYTWGKQTLACRNCYKEIEKEKLSMNLPEDVVKELSSFSRSEFENEISEYDDFIEISDCSREYW